VKERARHLSVLLGDLPKDEHLKIDAETVETANIHSGKVIIEGRYLHWVLSQVQANVCLIEIDCSDTMRVERWAERSKGSIGRSELAHMDAADQDFTSKMYGLVVPLQSELKIDTTARGSDECVQQILDWLENSNMNCAIRSDI
jgi:cytidylate kinase